MADAKKLFIIAYLPAGLEKAFLQYVRTFDGAFPGCHFEIACDAPDKTLAEAVEMLRLNPELRFVDIFERKRQ